MKTIILQGQLGKLFGRRHRMAVKTAGEAVRALVANFPAIERHLIETKNVGYRIKLHDMPLFKTEEMHHPVGGPTITITPVISGAKNVLGQILIGVAVIGLAFATGGISLAATGAVAFSGLAGQIAFGIGVSLILGGVAQMLAPTPKMGDPSERPENKPSYQFNGPVNTTAQGQPVPIGYGRLLVGGAVISAGLTTEEIPV